MTRWAGTEQRVLPRPWEEQTWLQNPPQPGFFPLGTEGACVLPTPQAVSGGGGGLDPSIPTSKLTQVPARTENSPKLEGISKKKKKKVPQALTKPEKGPSPECPLCGSLLDGSGPAVFLHQLSQC